MSSQLQNPGAVLLTTKQAAAQLQISERSVFRLIERGDLHSVSLGKSLRIHPDALERLAREGVRSINDRPIDRAELNTFITTIENMPRDSFGGRLQIVLGVYRDLLDNPGTDSERVNLADRIAVSLGSELLQVDAKAHTPQQRLAVRYIAQALCAFERALKQGA
jgi:excisionase family DNA binding protein